MTYDNDNIFAKILRGEIPAQKIYEDEYTLAFPDINPQAPVHVLIIPKGQYVSAADFGATASSAEITGFYRALSAVAKMLNIEETGYRIICNAGPDSHQLVPHFHAHILGGRKMGHILATAD
ncbi:MAG: HIT domain-containing protein [Rhodospirillales bacterium]|nr:HIT domain-containing protein [Rhodospirillales bacterium]